MNKFRQSLQRMPQHIKDEIEHNWSITEKVLNIMEAEGITHQQLADKMAIGIDELYDWFKGTIPMNEQRIAVIEYGLGESIT